MEETIPVQEEGTVVESHGDRARIRVARSSACKRCSVRAMCRPFGETFSVVEVANSMGAAQGQRVVVAIEPARLVKNALITYGIPAAAFVAGAVGGARVGRLWIGQAGTDMGAIVGAAVCLGLALSVTRLLDRAAAAKVGSLPRVIQILDD